MSDVVCPECESDRVAGYEVRGVYDGVLFWLCTACGRAFPRRHGHPRLNAASRRYARAFNNEPPDE